MSKRANRAGDVGVGSLRQALARRRVVKLGDRTKNDTITKLSCEVLVIADNDHVGGTGVGNNRTGRQNGLEESQPQ